MPIRKDMVDPRNGVVSTRYYLDGTHQINPSTTATSWPDINDRKAGMIIR